MKHPTASLAALAAATLALSTNAPAAALTYNTQGQFTIAFDASKLSPSPVGQQLPLDFVFTPASGSAAPAQITLSGLYFSSDWNATSADFSNAQITGNAKLNVSLLDVLSPPAPGQPYQSTIDFTNNENSSAKGSTLAPAEVKFNVDKVGSTGGFNLKYADPPGSDPSTFSFLLGGTSVFSASIAPGGQATILSEAAGVSFAATPGTNTPAVITPGAAPAVPEPAPCALLALGILPLLGVARRRSARA